MKINHRSMGSAIRQSPVQSCNRITHAAQAIDALGLRLTHPTFNYVRLLSRNI
ncbi:hypothetical protein NIES4073_21820 [Kalymmatonema gypsitolerans NIES-4073]|nr:hypothetical protein NIES4073_21820 [Scytonema sp. NIES-4073]